MSEESVVVKSGKFSKIESDLVLNTMKEYALENNINYQDICPHYRDVETKSNHRELWRKLETLLPNRRKVSIYQHAMRLIYSSNLKNQRNKSFTEEETLQLLKLVEVHGKNFSLIGRHLNKRPDDCKQYLIRMKRKKVGSFTLDEDKKIVNCVRDLLKIPPSGPLPHSDIPWTAIANKLNNERIPLDYLRRYNTILRLNKRYGYPDDENSFDILCKNNTNAPVDGDIDGDNMSDMQLLNSNHMLHEQLSVDPSTLDPPPVNKYPRVVRTPHCRTEELLEVKIKLLHWLKNKNFSHESEVIWVEADRSLAINVSRQHWISMRRILNNNNGHNSNEMLDPKDTDEYSANSNSLIENNPNIMNKSFREQLDFLIQYLESRRIEQANPISFRKSRVKSGNNLSMPNSISKHDAYGLMNDEDEDEEHLLANHMNFTSNMPQQSDYLPMLRNLNQDYDDRLLNNKRSRNLDEEEEEDPEIDLFKSEKKKSK